MAEREGVVPVNSTNGNKYGSVPYSVLEDEDEKQKDNSQETHTSTVYKFMGVVTGLASVVVCVISASSVQLLQQAIPHIELNTGRELFALVVFALALLVQRINPIGVMENICLGTDTYWMYCGYKLFCFLHSH